MQILDFFVYDVDFTAGIPAGSTANGSFTVQADSDFKWLKACYFADIAAAGQEDATRVIPLATILITDQGSGRQLMNLAVPIPSIFGTGQIPFILPVPKIFASKSTVAVTVVNFDAAQDYNLRLSFIGVKVFNVGN
jgi:hypothetical protein